MKDGKLEHDIEPEWMSKLRKADERSWLYYTALVIAVWLLLIGGLYFAIGRLFP